MQVQISSDPKFAQLDTLFILLGEVPGKKKLNLPRELRDRVSRMLRGSAFEGRAGEVLSSVGEDPAKITLVGLRGEEALNHRSVQGALFAVANMARGNRDRRIAVLFPYRLPRLDAAATTRWMADALSHSDYRYDPYITMREQDKQWAISCTYIPPDSISPKEAKRISEQAAIISDAVRTVRDLGNGPGNEITPTQLAERAAQVGKEAGFSVRIHDKKQIEKMKMGGLLAVNRGSAEEPRLIVMEWAPPRAKKTICLVGKGITFDSGGISIKPADKMEEMKFDMCGAAAVIGIMQAAARMKVRHRIIGIVPSTDNLPSGSAYKPGDIIRTMSGKTVEVVNTDAEGRMILCDALHYAASFKPDHLIDFATLTGACVVALGYEASGLFSNDDKLARKLMVSGEQCGERLWRLPEWESYRDYIRSEWADMKNSGGRWAGAVTAAVFLKEFVQTDSWAHIDIAGTAWNENKTPRGRKGATGVGVRAMVHFFESLT
ncbi:MAG TPA: leucyl aminopeptidase [Thermoanaerobaculia bacterium]|nr:leucyl aminopeptidase [Thermoanaerobaculia bacterium]